MSLVQGGKLRPLAVGSPTRLPQWPTVPTTAEAGVADYVFWVGLLAPAKTPRPAIDRLHAEIAKLLETPEIRTRFDTLGARGTTMKPDEFDAFIREELAANQRVISQAKLADK
jgi:tripartite-type tricarboxylate transporter receptor subunit TctC